MKKIAVAHGSCRDHYKLIADPRVEGGSAIEIKNTAFRSPGDFAGGGESPVSFSRVRFGGSDLPLFEIARVLVRFDHIPSFIVNANNSAM